jgi:FMN phosphatase YigB (HAD superfamily)
MLETRDQQLVYVKFLVMERPLRQLQNQHATLRTCYQIAAEEEKNLLRKLDYIGCRAKYIPLHDQLDKLQDKIDHILLLTNLVSEAMIKKLSVI